MDFITGLLVSKGYDSILVVVDCLSKIAHFLPVYTSIIALAGSHEAARCVMKLCELPRCSAGNHDASIQQNIVTTEKRGNRFENHPTHQYPTRTRTRSKAYHLCGSGIAY